MKPYVFICVAACWYKLMYQVRWYLAHWRDIQL